MYVPYRPYPGAGDQCQDVMQNALGRNTDNMLVHTVSTSVIQQYVYSSGNVKDCIMNYFSLFFFVSD